MTGFLQRLAERATGIAHTVRAVTAWSFGWTPLPPEETLPHSDSSARAHLAPSAPGPTRPAQSLAEPQGDVHATPEHEHRSAAMTRQAEQMAFHRGTVHRSAATTSSDETKVDRSPYGPTPPLIPTPLIPLISIPLRDGNAGPLPIATNPEDDRQLRPPSQASSRKSGPTQPVQAVTARVEPLLPLTVKACRMVRPATSLDSGGRRETGRVEENTEIHISIGRIEVTAIHEPAPAKPVASRRKAPMSLDEYLAVRQGGRP